MARSSKAPTGGGTTTDDPAVLAAIAYADEKAGDDDRAFMRMPEERVTGTPSRGAPLGDECEVPGMNAALRGGKRFARSRASGERARAQRWRTARPRSSRARRHRSARSAR